MTIFVTLEATGLTSSGERNSLAVRFGAYARGQGARSVAYGYDNDQGLVRAEASFGIDAAGAEAFEVSAKAAYPSYTITRGEESQLGGLNASAGGLVKDIIKKQMLLANGPASLRRLAKV
ncbi:MAG: hypothetical protein GC136_01350 [Alphaproteobacteria bacterium]|nr:hypothetical protein [Alphaproteobacteria bacterium]